jgi:acyl-CoA thioesterase FadM
MHLFAENHEPPTGRELATIRRRVAMGDVDAAGLLYVAVPYAWQEGMWTSVLYEHGHGLSGLMADGNACPVVASSATYLSPVSLDSMLVCRLYADHIGRSSFGVRMNASRPDGTIALSVSTRHVWSELRAASLESAPLPRWLRDLLS